MFDFSHVSDKEIEEAQSQNFLLEPGRCKYIVEESVEHISQSSGNKSIKLVLKVKDVNGKVAKVFKFLDAQGLVKFLVVHDLEEAIQKKCVKPTDLLNLKGELQLTHDTWKGETKNSVHYFVKAKTEAPKAVKAPEPPANFDDDVPF